MSRITSVFLGTLAAAALAMVACDGGDSPTEPDPLGQFAGRWAGMVERKIPPVFAYPAQMSLAGQTPSGRVGSSEYPSLGCGGGLFREGPAGVGNLVVVERLEHGQQSCADGGTIRVALNVNGTLDWQWHFADGTLGATGTLSRD